MKTSLARLIFEDLTLVAASSATAGAAVGHVGHGSVGSIVEAAAGAAASTSTGLQRMADDTISLIHTRGLTF